MANSPVDETLRQFEREHVRVPQEEIEAAKQLHPAIRAVVEADLTGHIETFLSGSYARHTQSLHLKDVDMIVVLQDEDGSFAASAEDALEAVQEVLDPCELVRETEVSVRAVKVSLWDHPFTVDVVPALRPKTGDGLLLARHMPDKGFDDWTRANPKGQTEAAHAKNAATNGRYIPLVRLIKFWNLRTGRLLKSYHAEAMLWHSMLPGDGYLQGLAHFFAYAEKALAPGTHVKDPGNARANVDDMLTDGERYAARSAVSKAKESVKAAVSASSPDKALLALGTLFGPALRSSDPNAADKLAQAMRSGTLRAAGTGTKVGAGREFIATRSWREP